MACSCIVPFFNEAPRIADVLDVLLQVNGLEDIIAVDDGSTDGTADLVRTRFPSIRLLRHTENRGKTAAVKTGLDAVRTEHVLLVDADLRGAQSQDFEAAIDAIQTGKTDMIILKRVRNPFLASLLGVSTLLSGERVMSAADLRAVLQKDIQGYQIEVAMNEYMMRAGKLVHWMPSFAKNVLRVKKRGVAWAITSNVRMFSGFIRAVGFKSLVGQVCCFARERFVLGKSL